MSLLLICFHQTYAENWYNPTKHAFISGAAVPNMIIVNIETGQQLGNIRLPVAAKIFSSATDAPYLAFSDKFSHALYTINLTNGSITKHPMPSAVYRILFLPKSSQLVAVLEKRIAVLDYKTGNLDIIEREFQNLYTRFNTIISVYSQTIWVTQENTPLIYAYNLNKPQEGWQTIDIEETRGLGKGAPSFEDKVIAVNTYYAGQGIIYFTDSGKTIKTGEMYNSRPLNEQMVEPYIDNNTRHVIFADKSGHLKIYDLAHSEVPQDVYIHFPPRQIRTGWMDQYFIVSGDQAIGIYPFVNPKNGGGR